MTFMSSQGKRGIDGVGSFKKREIKRKRPRGGIHNVKANMEILTRYMGMYARRCLVTVLYICFKFYFISVL